MPGVEPTFLMVFLSQLAGCAAHGPAFSDPTEQDWRASQVYPPAPPPPSARPIPPTDPPHPLRPRATGEPEGEPDGRAGEGLRLILETQIRNRLYDLLGPAQVPPPGVRTATQAQTQGNVRVEVRPVRPEDQAWNHWDDGMFRYFNNSRGYLWEVRIDTPTPLRWMPAATLLTVNERGTTFSPATTAEECVKELLMMSWWQMQDGPDLGLSSRLSSMEPLRQVYLPAEIGVGAHTWVVYFPAPALMLDPVAMEFSLALTEPGQGTRRFTLLFE